LKFFALPIFGLLLLNIMPQSLSSVLSSPAVSFLIVIGLSVTVHELGHFLAAIVSKVGVLKFSVGFGPAILKKYYKGTEYRVGILPLGGYVRMVGDMPDMITGQQATDDEVRSESEGTLPDQENLPEEVKAMIADKSKWFIEKNNWIKSFIVFAGPLANYLLAFFLVLIVALIYGIQVPDGTKIDRISKGSPADVAGLKSGDELLTIAGKPLKDFTDIMNAIQASNGEKLEIKIKREGIEELKVVSPEEKPSPREVGKKIFMIGIAPATKAEAVSVGSAFSNSFSYINSEVINILSGVFGLLSGQVSLDAMGGPIMIYEVAGQTAKIGFLNFLNFIVHLNLTLGVMNLLPIPVLDGGHLIIFFLEGLLGPISIRKKEFAQGIGMAFILGLSIFAIHNDLNRDKDYLKPKAEEWKDMGKEPEKASAQP
jgi:regulator of sigma E protease